MTETIGLVVAAYVLGSVPFGFMIARAGGVDLRQVGSGNIGSTNVYRALGLKIALLVFALDACKGLIATIIFPMLASARGSSVHLGLVCGIAVTLGSVAGVFMRFRGGKGVATAVGVFMGLVPLATAICLALWIVLVGVFKYVSLGSLCGAIALPILVAVFDREGTASNPVFYLSVAIAALVVVRHRSNIKRLLSGTENRIGRLEERTK
ncbi:MAG: glycerol-3-phosphate 1-O-acyltransferase PlsY [Candidatus Eisenbacteria bacterium]